MEPLFGTDGIRGVAGDPPLDCDTVYRVGFCLTEYLRDLDRRPRILVARDTRISGPWLEAVLNRAILDAGGVTEMCGVISTPAVSFLTAREGAQAGIMISASHNPYQDNGIKIFSSTGLKLNDALEEHLELKIISSSRTCPPGFSISDQFTPEVLSDTFPAQGELYTRHLRECLPRDFDLKGMRLVVDCAHGALSHIAPDFLSDLGAGVDRLHCEPTAETSISTPELSILKDSGKRSDRAGPIWGLPSTVTPIASCSSTATAIQETATMCFTCWHAIPISVLLRASW